MRLHNASTIGLGSNTGSWERIIGIVVILARQADLFEVVLFERGNQARLARELGVSRATICRDVRAILAWGHPCPCCGAYMKPPAKASISVFEDEELLDEATLLSPLSAK